MGDPINYRHATAADVPAINTIYNHFVEETAITFDLKPTTDQERLTWFEQFGTDGPHQIIVAETPGVLIGYAGTTQFRTKLAYSTSVEATIYVSPQNQGQGVGHGLYSHLFQALEGQDLHRIYAGITLPNEKSVDLHQKWHFTHVGTFREVGRKFGRFWDVAWYERHFG